MGLKKIIDDNRTEIYRFLSIYLFCLGVFLVIQIFTGGVPFLFILLVPFILAMTIMAILHKSADSLGGRFYGGPRLRLSMDETLKSDMDRVRFSKRSGRFEEALNIIGEVLKKAPDYPEALLIKAQIYHEEYGYNESARKCLQKIIDTAPGGSEVRRWADHYLEQMALSGDKENENDGPAENGADGH